ncbi:unnamed protein product [Peniophora sp. CBMAI 1063]|nr:unnamed protein product [Peniophora sp. CBMAI 1063]
MSNDPEESRAAQANALHQAYLVALVAELEARRLAAEEDDSSSSSSDSGSDTDSDDEDFPVSSAILDKLANLFSERYLKDRLLIRKTSELLDLLLNDYKINRPEIFRSYLRVTPQCFDDLVKALGPHAVFQNKSNNSQTDPACQIAIALYRLGHYGNAASTMKVALQFGISYGSVQNFTSRFFQAVTSTEFQNSSLKWATPRAKAEAMEWVEQQTCPSWRKGWLMVDGTLVPLFRRPGYFGNNFFDRKANYSTAVEIVSLPDLRIIDFSVGRPGSTHNSTGWRDTWVYQRREGLLRSDEWIWGDSAYPLTKWCQSPYIKPEKRHPDNKQFNYYLSRVRVRSEHAIGYLKGRWASLKGLRVSVDDLEGLKFASIWIRSAIILHSYAMEHERNAGQAIERDGFFMSGRRYMRRKKRFEREWKLTGHDRTVYRQQTDAEEEESLAQGQEKREWLKERLFAELGMELHPIEEETDEDMDDFEMDVE